MIEIQNISKSFGDEVVLKNLHTELHPNTIYGLLGKNGAGKTTLINLMMGFLEADSGDVVFDGKSIQHYAHEIKQSTGILSDDLPLVDQLTGYHNLEFAASLYGLPAGEAKMRFTSLFEYFFDDVNELHKPLKQYSTGMRKKLMLISAVMHKPKVLIMDEPFTGLDPVAVKQMIEFIRSYKQASRTLLISSHDLSYIERIADHILVLHDHNFVFNDTLKQFTTEGSTMIDEALYNILVPEERNTEDINWLFEN